MKKLIILFFLLIFSTLANAQMPGDFIYHALPTSITFDLPEDVAQIAGNTQSAVNTSRKMVMQLKSDVNNIRSAAITLLNDIKSGAIFEITGNPGQGKGQFCGKSLSETDVKDISKKFKQNFFTIKSGSLEDIARSSEMREKFYMDNLYAIYAASKIMQQRLRDEIAPKIEEAQSCARGKCNESYQMPSTEDGGNNESIFVYGKTLQTLDDLVREWESVAALKSRLLAVDVMYHTEPVVDTTANKKQEGEQVSSLTYPKATHSIKNTSEIAFAQITYPKGVEGMANQSALANPSGNAALNFIGKMINFTSPAPSQNEHPLMSLQEEMNAVTTLSETESVVNEAIEIHNMIKGLAEYKETAEKFRQMQEEYQQMFERLQKSEQCAIRFMGKYFSDPVSAWSGINLTSTKNNHNHDLRRGISAWAIEAFETAKAAEVSVITEDDIAENSMSDEELEGLVHDPDFSKANSAASQSISSVSQSDQDEAAIQSRTASLLKWNIGAEAAKMLGKNPSAWGSGSGTKMVWNDTKNFYKQYLKLKYDNVKSYLKSYTPYDILALVVAKLKGQDQDMSSTKYQQQLSEINAKYEEDLHNIYMENYTVSDAAVEELITKKKILEVNIDDLTHKVVSLRNRVAEIRETAEKTAQANIEARISADTDFNNPDAPAKLTPEEVEQELAALKESLINKTEIKELQQKIDSFEKSISDCQAELASVKLQINLKIQQSMENVNVFDFVAAIAELQKNKENDINKAAEAFKSDVKTNVMAILNKMAESNPQINPLTMFGLSVTEAEKALGNINGQIDSIVDSAYNQMLSLGDSLYSQSHHEVLEGIHNDMLTKIKAIAINYSVNSLLKVNGIVVFAKLAAADTSPEEEGFFVGATPKLRDIKAPFPIIDFDAPALREIFYFDADDYNNVKPYVEGSNSTEAVTAEAFLNSGREIPKIWQHMLKDFAFIETKYKLKDALNLGCEEVAFSRGGVMPCKIASSSIVLDIDKKGKYLVRNDMSASQLPECMLIKIKDGKPYHSFWDSPVKISSGTPQPHNCLYSELGTILDADENNNLYFRKRLFDAYNLLLQSDDIKRMNKNKKDELASAKHALIERNQIGDFLKHVEAEKLSRENLEKYKAGYDAEVEALKSRLKMVGYEPSSDFDLANDEDYDLAKVKLKELRDQKISEAMATVNSTPTAGNDLALERAVRMRNAVKAMQADTEFLLTVSLMDETNENLEERLIRAKADKELSDKYKKSLQDEAGEYNNPEDPFCANY